MRPLAAPVSNRCPFLFDDVLRRVRGMPKCEQEIRVIRLAETRCRTEDSLFSEKTASSQEIWSHCWSVTSTRSRCIPPSAQFFIQRRQPFVSNAQRANVGRYWRGHSNRGWNSMWPPLRKTRCPLFQRGSSVQFVQSNSVFLLSQSDVNQSEATQEDGQLNAPGKEALFCRRHTGLHVCGLRVGGR